MKRLGIIRQGYSQPLFHILRNRILDHPDPGFPFTLIEDSTAILAQKLRQKELDAAFLSPIDYALNHARYSILPEVGLISAGESRAVQLLFKEHLNKIQTIAINPHVSASDVVLANIVLAEKYELAPQILPVANVTENILLKIDAVLLTGDDVFTLHDAHRLDLVEEWSDITELPYVHGAWITSPDALSDSETRGLIAICEQGVSEFEFTGPQQKWYEEHFGYRLHEDALSALGEFFQMAFYHGIMKEVVTPRFLQVDKISRN
ncbi:MAG: MqnA/MqnD/SBP family protein [Bacteroidota bacterium]